MDNVFVFCVITLTLASASSASDNIILYSEDDEKLQVEYGTKLTSTALKLDFYEDCVDKDPTVCTKTKQRGNENFLIYFSESERPECVHFDQVAQSMNDVLTFCVEMGTHSWYGGAETTFQHWPLNKLNWTDKPFVTREADSQAVVESYFFNSQGFYIHIDDSVPLFVDINGPHPGHMCFSAKVVRPYRKDTNFMRFRVCKFDDPREAHENAIKDFLGTPMSVPDPYVVKYPIWSTWARYKTDVDTDHVYKYAQEIIDHGFHTGTIEIDDDWETCYGSAEFNTTKFENIKRLTSKLKSMGFKISLWTHPFVNLECEKHAIGQEKGYFVNSTSNTINSTWWNGKASYIDFTNPEAATWWSNALRELTAKSGIDTLKFDAGESSWVPDSPQYFDDDLTYYPDNIVNAYLRTIVGFGNGIEYRSSRRSQEFGRFLRMIDRESRWDFQLGLPTLITSLLQLNMIGYPFVLPDMVGGNGYNNVPPSKEMYIRWMQANVFMPAVQFSYTPWDFDQQTIDLCRHYMGIRDNHTDTIIRLMRKSVSDGSPVNPPIWWIDPTDSVAHYIYDEYLLGEDILVAPVIVEKATSRDIYLPAGLWRDENNLDSPLVPGRTWLNEYPAAIDVLPWFTRVSSESQPSSSVGLASSAGVVLAAGFIACSFR